MKEWSKQNWFKIVLLLLALIWVCFSLILPRYAGAQCQKFAEDAPLIEGRFGSYIPVAEREKLVNDSYDLAYKRCMDKWGY